MALPQESAAAAAAAEWDDPANWAWPGIYYAPRDPRVLVPKRPVRALGLELNLGWTLNFADARSLPTLAALVGLPLLALQLLPRRGARRSP